MSQPITITKPSVSETSAFNQPIAVDKIWRYEDYLALPDDGKRYEIIADLLYVSHAPDSAHQFIVAEIMSQLTTFVELNQLGRVILAPFEVHLSETSRPVQPDVLFVSAERWPGGTVPYFEGAPDLVVEVISPSSVRTDRTVKLMAYEQAEVREYWLADPKTRSVEIYTLAEGKFVLAGQYVAEEVITSPLLPGLEIITQSLFNG